MKNTLLRRSVAILVMITIVTIGLFAETTSAGNVKFITAGPNVEAKLEAGYSLKIPMMQGDGPLFSGNNLKVKGLVGVSPVAATVSLDAILTPIAVIELNLGASFGTGWDFGLLDLEGLRLSTGGIGTALSSDQLGGMYYKVKAGAAFQFDTAAIFPGDWTSVVLRTYHELNYQGYTNADKNIAWEYETSGAMENGFNYKGEYLVGYQMPIKLNMVAVLLETYAFDMFPVTAHPFLYDLGLVMNYAFTDSLNLTVIPQVTTVQKDAVTREISYKDLSFKRVALMLNYSF
ncbi:hypothetical protein SpiGrapes_2351 [Sphaerochaeta pleomorpha str. Grapes]|uniref:Uncharacterized protein n=1 Tax=Sphaerochaeta pleomorpha (strain ATCC BAA-1885 / DSM 22778 / Grapes) TaxID=158190 RepID=G8QSU3_SPHPG|nr:hypothetical protein [Sphaerochaeta pleomorpha]AEV30125.1 hypothetical protein SpiGrapes_2351 [Sphaerochaeta pleomorpha str. Grapes]